VSRETSTRIVSELAKRGYNAEREAVTLLAGAADPGRALERAVERAPGDAVVLDADLVREVLESGPQSGSSASERTAHSGQRTPAEAGGANPPISSGTPAGESPESGDTVPVETKGSAAVTETGGATESSGGADAETLGRTGTDRSVNRREITVSGDVRSTGTGEYRDFVAVFRDRYEKLAGQLRGRVGHLPTDAVADKSGGSDAAIIGMVSDIRSTANGHWLVELEDTNGTFPCLVMKDRDFAADVRTLLHDEVIAVEGTLSDDNGGGDGIMFVDEIHFPDIPRTYTPSTADREVSAVLVSDVHVGSQEFMEDAWHRFADWLHTPEAESVEYLLIAGDMVEGVGVYPDQDEELDVVDIYDQYEAFNEYLKEVPGDMEIVMIPGNHDAVRLAEPQPGFDEELREIMSAHDCRISSNPSMVTVEGVDFLMYHGVSLDEVIAELPDEKATYDDPHEAMYQLLRKRHVAPQFGGHTRLAPEEEDYLVIEEVPDVFHAGHVHKFGYGKYHGVLTINSGCWQAQTAFQESVNIDPDTARAPIVDLQTLDLTIRKFA